MAHMDAGQLNAKLAQLDWNQLHFLIVYAHAWEPDAVEYAIDCEEKTRPAGQGGVLFKVGDDDEALTAVAL